MPRENPQLNRTWMCDEGRLSFKKHHTHRILKARVRQETLPVEEALRVLGSEWKGLKGGEVAGLASPWASLEDNWILKRLFKTRWDERDLAASTLGSTGTGDDILRLGEKCPNTAGLRMLGISTDPTSILKGIESGRVKALVLLENDVVELAGDRFEAALSKVPHVLLLSTHATAGTVSAESVVPVRTHAEKNGTFVSAGGRLQRFRSSIEPEEADVPESSMALAAFARTMGQAGFEFTDPVAVFDLMASETPALKGLTFSSIPPVGQVLDLGLTAPPPFKNLNASPNVVPGAAP
jgi:NADH-quinone oxidoreductase subunit G